MKGILLDTHAFVWAADGERHRFSTSTQAALEHAATTNTLHIAAITLWEVAMLAGKQRLNFDVPVEQWLERALNISGARVVPLDIDVAGLSTRLALHGDPANRLIVASALVHGLTLCTQDEKILDFARQSATGLQVLSLTSPAAPA